MDAQPLLETWDIHSRVNLYLLDAILPAHLSDLSASKGRTVGEQFAHIHNVRLMWLKHAAPELMGKLTKIEKEHATNKASLEKALNDSAAAIKALLAKGIESGGKIKGFKPHVTAFLGYLISHESHHRGQIALSLKQSNHPVSKKISFGIWEWGVR
ncbi:MAG TPA: DinB family protein [Pyrinomonadaceae bacterium]